MHHEIFIIISIILSTEWKSLHSRVIGVNFYTLPNICEISPDGPSPSCHLGDGFTDLVIVKECSRLQMHSHIQRNFNSKDQVSFVVMSEILMFTKPKILTKNLTKNILVNNQNLKWHIPRRTSLSTVHVFHIKLEFSSVCFCGGMKTRELREPKSNNPCSDARSRIQTQADCWKASTLTTVPLLLLQFFFVSASAYKH